MLIESSEEELVPRLRRNALWTLVVLTIGVGIVTREIGSIVGVLLAGLLMLANFHLLSTIVGRALDRAPELPGYGGIALLVGRLVLMALLLYGIVLLPGVGPIPVALGLSVLVLAVLIEALIQAFSG